KIYLLRHRNRICPLTCSNPNCHCSPSFRPRSWFATFFMQTICPTLKTLDGHSLGPQVAGKQSTGKFLQNP
ncbi:hypothetical protein MUO56_03925, partial [Candidatus Bathyarchaeota archaeon]|nr:hypothetical protein [Candidatus Bathyarchaeota archaeon]